MSETAGFRVTLLGTGTPIPRPDRFGPSTLVEAGDQKLLIDAGRGATIRLYQLEIPIGRIDVQLLTHYHSDHVACLPDIWLTGWLESHFGTRKTPYKVIGPTGAMRLMENLERAYADDIKIRVADEKLPLSGIATDVAEFDRDGVVYENNGVKVTAFEVDHGDIIKPCYGYRVEYGGRVAVFSSDTRYNRNVIKYGTGADLLVHEVASARPELMKESYVQRIIGHHTTPREAGQVFAQAKPKLAVYTHIVLLGSERISPPTIEEVIAETRQTYRGPLVAGEDLVAFEIGEAVEVRRPNRSSLHSEDKFSLRPTDRGKMCGRASYVRVESKDDILSPKIHVQVTPDSRHRAFMSARPRLTACEPALPSSVPVCGHAPIGLPQLCATTIRAAR
jgi:ribonuclease Z